MYLDEILGERWVVKRSFGPRYDNEYGTWDYNYPTSSEMVGWFGDEDEAIRFRQMLENTYKFHNGYPVTHSVEYQQLRHRVDAEWMTLAIIDYVNSGK